VDKIFLRALIISLCSHFLLLFPWPSFNRRLSPKSLPEIEISYFEIRENSSEEINQAKIVTAKESENQELPQEKVIVEEKREEIPQVEKEEKRLPPSLTKEEEMSARDFASLSKEPVFLNYYRAIREKIKISANRNKPAFFRPGEVCIFFVLDKKGELRRLKIIEAKSSPDPHLRQTSLISMEEASPFPPFPEGLNREQIAFSIIIAFEIR